MASMSDLTDALDARARSGAMKTHIDRLPEFATARNLRYTVEGLTSDELQSLIMKVIEIETARTGDVLSPTEYRNRFSGLDID